MLQRIYDGAANRQSRQLSSNYEAPKYPVNTFSDGWALNIPWVETNAGAVFVRLPDGQTRYANFSDHVFEYKKRALL